MTLQARYLLLKGATSAEIRSAQFDGKAHVVVPVVALFGGAVIHASNADAPELVPAGPLAASVPGWNGEPVVGDHPKLEGVPVSANTPGVLESQSFGRVFNARFADNRLHLEAWLDPERAERVGRDAVRVIERCRAGEAVEVSVGCYAQTVERSGESGGKHYEAEWLEILPDHLAMLPEGARGACSNEDGCGAPRLMRRHLVTASGLELQDEQESNMAKPAVVKVEVDGSKFLTALRERVRSLFGGSDALELLRFRGAEEGVSDADLRGSLDRALFAEEPGYLGIDAVFAGENLVVYAVAPEQKVTLYRRAFTLDEGGAVTLAGEKEAVEPVTRYEPVTASKSEAEPVAASCGCHKPGDGLAAQTQGETMSKTKELVGRLIANERSPFVDADRAYLEALSETRLSAFEGLLEDAGPLHPVPAVEAKTEMGEKPKEEPPKADPQAVTLSRGEYEDMRAAAASFKAQQKREKDTLVSTLKTAQDAYTGEELSALSLDELQKVAKLAKVEQTQTPSFLGRGVPRTADSTEDVWRNPPDGYRLNERSQNKEAN